MYKGRTKMRKHRHRFNEDGIHVNYCVNKVRGKFCVYAKEKKTGKVGKFVIIDGQGRVPQ